MPMPAGNGGNPQFYAQWTVEGSQNWLFAKSLDKEVYQLGVQVVDLENTGLCATLICWQSMQ